MAYACALLALTSRRVKRNEQIYESAAALVAGSTYLFGDERLAKGL
jgi:hypothetical protein